MGLALALPLVIVAIKALLRFRHRVDVILSLNEASAGLPFRLPPAPVDLGPHMQAMLAFFTTQNGAVILELAALTQAYQDVKKAHDDRTPIPNKQLNDCFTLYFEAADIEPSRLEPAADAAAQRQLASSGPSVEMRLAYYVVESHRLSRNPALTRVLLATADTLLEVAGESAGLFISNPRTRAIVESLLQGFAIERNFDDDSAEMIFKRLLGVAASVALTHQAQFGDGPALRVLFAALSDVRVDLGDDFVARLISRDGFEKLVAAFAGHVADDPSFISSSDLAQEAIAVTLRQLSQQFPAIIEGDTDAVFSVLEAGLAISAAHVGPLLQQKLANIPLAAAVLTEVARRVQDSAGHNLFFKNLATGPIVGDLYKASLTAIASNAAVLGTQTGLGPFVSELVTGVAGALSTTPLTNVLSGDTLRSIASRSLEALAHHPELVGRHPQFAAKVVGAVFEAAAPLVQDGLQRDDLITVVDAALEAAAGNFALVHLDDTFRIVLTDLMRALGDKGLQLLLHSDGRREILLNAIRAIAVNPTIWRGFHEKALVQPLAAALVAGLASDPTQLLSGPILVDAMRQTLTTVARRGKTFIDRGVQPEVLRELLAEALAKANDAIGVAVDGATLPHFLEHVLLAFLSEPFALTTDTAKRDALIAAAVQQIDMR